LSRAILFHGTRRYLVEESDQLSAISFQQIISADGIFLSADG